MRNLAKWMRRIAITLLLLAVGLIVFGFWGVRRSWPTINGTVQLAGLQDEVTVKRDDWGIPHIYAENEHDLLFAQGYVHAQDRLWQMELFRRNASGQLAELFGEVALGNDRFMRNMMLRHSAIQQFEDMDPEARDLLTAYTDGVNAYVTTHEGKLPLEFIILRHEPEMFSEIDFLTWGNAMSMHLGANRRLEHLRAKIVEEHGLEAMDMLLPFADENTPVLLPEEVNNYQGLASLEIEDTIRAFNPLGDVSDGIGSNAWVVSGEHTDTGMPLLSNDLHMGVTMPAGWYGNALHGGRFDVTGYTMPGVPLVLTGHNERIAWGPTNLGPDTQDFYMERLDDPNNPTQYEYMGEWYDLEERTETYKIKGQDELFEETYFVTGHGPLMYYTMANADLENFQRDGGENVEHALPLALKWTLYDGNQLFEAIVALNTAQNWDEFRVAASMWDSPGQNMMYADVDGNIGYQAATNVPLRENHEGSLPVPGWTGEYEWTGYVPFDELPSFLNPPGGVIASANSRIEPEGYPYRISDSYMPGYRLDRIYTLLDEHMPLTLDDMWEIQGDNYANEAVEFYPRILDIIEPTTELEKAAYAELEAWDMILSKESVGGSVYESWHQFMLQNILVDDFEDSANDYIQGDYIRHASQHVPMMIKLMDDPNHDWFDDKTTDEIETRDDIVQKSFEDGVARLAESHGDNVENWAWGGVHKTFFRHQPFASNKFLARFFNPPSINAPGGNFTINTHAFQWSHPFNVWIVPIVSHVTDVSDWDNSVMNSATGQNANLYHPHREDIIKLWENHEYHEMNFSDEMVDEKSKNVLVMEPMK